MSEELKRRSFILGAAAACVSTGAALVTSACKPLEDIGSTTDSNPEESLSPLPPSSPDPDNPFGIDLNINTSTIDQYLNRSDVVYRDLRMLVDPSTDKEIDSAFSIEDILEGFRIVPFPFLAQLPADPQEGKYSGETLISLESDEEDNIISHHLNYEESLMVIDDLFPKDKAIFLVCRLGDHSDLMRKLLIHLGWQEDLIYNVGGMWAYNGAKVKEITVYTQQVGGNNYYATWRADYAPIDFNLLHKV